MHTSRKFKLSLRIETIENIFSVISIELRFGIFTKFWATFVLSRLTKEKLRRNDRKEKINKNSLSQTFYILNQESKWVEQCTWAPDNDKNATK